MQNNGVVYLWAFWYECIGGKRLISYTTFIKTFLALKHASLHDSRGILKNNARKNCFVFFEKWSLNNFHRKGSTYFLQKDYDV